MNKGGEGVLLNTTPCISENHNFWECKYYWIILVSEFVQDFTERNVCTKFKKMCQETLLHLSADTYRYINLTFFYNPLSTFSGD